MGLTKPALLPYIMVAVCGKLSSLFSGLTEFSTAGLTPQMDQQRLATPARGFDKIGEYCVPGPSTRNGFYLETSKSAPSLPSSDIPSNFLPLHCTFPGRESNPVNTFPPSFSAVDGSCLALQYPQINSFDGNGYYFPQVMSGAQDFAARSSHSNGTAGIIQGFDNR